MYKTTPPREKSLLLEQIISIVIIFKPYLSQFNIYIYYVVLLGLFIAKYFKEGNTFGSVLQYLATILLLVSSLTGFSPLTYVGIVIAILNSIFISPTIYTLPEFSPKVGLKQNFSKMKNNKQLYWSDWHPIAEDQNNESYQIKWAHTSQIQKTTAFANTNNKIVIKLFQFFISYFQTYRLKLAKGNPGKFKGDILFSHGRGGTPFIYTSLLRSFGRDWRILAPQHSQVNVTPYTDPKDIKKYRQNQVKQRAQQIVYLTSQIGQTDPIVLMGHSYGCATVLQAYHLMPLSVKKRVTHIILFDPWLYSLPQNVFNAQIICPVLMLTNQYFLSNEHVYELDKQFVKKHQGKITYICWKNGNHMHQSDLLFLLGSSFGLVKNHKDSWSILERSIQAAQMFLDFTKVGVEEQQKIRNKFSEYDLGPDFKPQKWKNQLNL